MKKASKIVLKCLEEQNMSQRHLASRMGEDVRKLNQQIHRQNDMKVERFSDVLEHIGYRLEVVSNDGIQRVCPEFAHDVIDAGKPNGSFYAVEDGIYTGIDSTSCDVRIKEFNSYEECVKWLKNESAIDDGSDLKEV